MSVSSKTTKRTTVMNLQGDQLGATKRAKITDEQADEEELVCWSGPTPSPQSPVRRDCPIKVTEPGIRLPKRGIRGGVSREKHRNATEEVQHESMDPGADQQSHDSDVDASIETVEEQFRQFDEPVHIQIFQSTDGKEQEEIICWSGPPKAPPSPIQRDKPIVVTEPVYRLPRRLMENLNNGKSTDGTDEGPLDSNNQSGSAKGPSGVEIPGINKRKSTDGQSTSEAFKVQKNATGSKHVSKKPKPSHSAWARTGVDSGSNTADTHIPPRDPLLHVPIVTPPCPINPTHRQTPTPLRSYTHATELPDHFIPNIGQQFRTFDEAYEFYNAYARHTGFGIKKSQHNKYRRYMRCVCEGKNATSVAEGERQRDRGSKRTGCKACIGLKEKPDGTCVVKSVVFEHNHTLVLSPAMLVFLHSHKKVDSNLREYVKDLQFSNVKHVHIMGILSRLCGGRGKIGCHEKDVLNMKAANTRKEAADPVKKMFKFFDDMKDANENFYSDVHVDEHKRIKNIFWSNASCRAAYADFGDCVTFDTTYKSNKYHMPLAVFVGVNNHLQSTIFGVALMGDESADSFKWVFSTFLKCMRGRQPICILTDQCPSMAKAIPKIFKRTLHKLCRWHIMRKHKGPLGKLYKLFPGLQEQLLAVLNHPLMPAEFESAWHALVQKYSLHNVTVMVSLWNERKDWISAYWKDVFCARMTSTQRSESMNFVLKRGFVKEEDDLHVFVQQVNNCIQARREAENAEADASTTVRKTITRYGFEAQAMEHYTRAVYTVFRQRQFESTGFRIKIPNAEKPTEFLVHHYNQSRVFAWSRHEFHVLADIEEGRFACECKMWEHTGLFCHHVIAVFEHLRLDEIPRRYILQRYSKNAVKEPEFNRKDYKETAADGTSLEYRRTILYNEAMKTVNKGCSSDHMFDKALAAFKEVNSRLDDESDSSNNVNSADNEPPPEHVPEPSVLNFEFPEAEDTDQYADILPPPVAKTKGSKNKETKEAPDPTPAPARPLPELDENGKPKGQRLCSNCNQIKGHNARTCLKSQMAAQLLEAHTRIYGKPTSEGEVKVAIKNLLAKQAVGEANGEEILDTDEDEDYEDETEDEDEENPAEDKDEDEDEDEEEQEDEDNISPSDVTQTNNEDHIEQHEQPTTEAPGQAGTNVNNKLITERQRTCSICGKREKHNARKCPYKDEILREQLAAAQKGGTVKKMESQGVRVCGNCGLIKGHNARTCQKLQLKEQLRQEQLKLQKQLELQATKSGPIRNLQKPTKNTDNSKPQPKPRRSNRLM